MEKLLKKDEIFRMKKIIFVLIAGILILNLAFANARENFTETKKLIDSKISCDKLTNEQLEEIGDYLMELMHPGEAHIQMHNMMGGENSESVKSMHINMAKMMYCNNGEGMNNMMNMMSGGMMDSSMMNMMNGQNIQGSMMGSYGTGMLFFNWITYLLVIGLIVSAIYWLIKSANKKR